jgi:polyhydroxyalkanoate synthesis regulator phasin
MIYLSNKNGGMNMKSVLNQILSLGIGAAILSKEQIEKTVDELVKKGEISKGESKEFIDRWIEKGSEMKKEVDEMVQDKVNNALHELNLVTRDELEELKQRIEKLEKKQG